MRSGRFGLVWLSNSSFDEYFVNGFVRMIYRGLKIQRLAE